MHYSKLPRLRKLNIQYSDNLTMIYNDVHLGVIHLDIDCDIFLAIK